jgi:hypothetical protein
MNPLPGTTNEHVHTCAPTPIADVSGCSERRNSSWYAHCCCCRSARTFLLGAAAAPAAAPTQQAGQHTPGSSRCWFSAYCPRRHTHPPPMCHSACTNLCRQHRPATVPHAAYGPPSAGPGSIIGRPWPQGNSKTGAASVPPRPSCPPCHTFHMLALGCTVYSHILSDSSQPLHKPHTAPYMYICALTTGALPAGCCHAPG